MFAHGRPFGISRLDSVLFYGRNDPHHQKPFQLVAVPQAHFSQYHHDEDPGEVELFVFKFVITPMADISSSTHSTLLFVRVPHSGYKNK